MKKINTLILSGIVILGLGMTQAHADESPINTLSGSLFDTKTGIAIKGYDPVAYFMQNKPVKGVDAYVYEWQGAKWKFANQADLDAFKVNPAKYAPQYGGYCAYGVANDNLVSIEPDKFTIIDGKLYLNYDGDVQTKWLKDTAGYIRKADGKFTALLKK